MFLNELGPGIEAAQSQMQFSVAPRRGADDQRAARDVFGEIFKPLRGFEDFGRADRGTRALESDIIGMHQTKTAKSKIADGARGRADVQRIAGIDQPEGAA